ncbi:hypothetical protein HDU89_006937 [Geranomyces variabilis]|nr:hypothetical protein HDU89_006937 [Geranomyces variabilis]
MEHSTLAPWLLSYPPTTTTDINDESSSGAFQHQQQQPRRHRHRTSNTTGTTSTRLSERRAAATLLQTSAELAVFLSGGVNYHDEECDEDEGDARNDDGFGDDFDADNHNDDDYGVNILPGLLLANRYNGGSNGDDDDDDDDDDEELLPTLQTVDMLRDRIRGDLSTVRSEIDSLQSWYQQYSERIASAVLAGFFGNGRRARGGGGGDDDGTSLSAGQPAVAIRRAIARHSESVSGDAANYASASSFLRQPPPPPPPPPLPQQQQQRSSYQQREDRAIRMAIPIEWADLPDIPLRRFGISPTFASSLSSSATTRRATRRANRRAQQQLQDSQLSRQPSSQQQQQPSHYAQLLTADGDLWTTEHETTYSNAILTPNEAQQHSPLSGSGGCILSGGHLWTPNLFYERRPACCRAHAAAVVLDGLDADGNDVCERMREESGVGVQDRSLFFCDVQDWSVGAAGLMSVMMARQGGEVVGR